MYYYVPDETTYLDKLEFEVMKGELRNKLNTVFMEIGDTIFKSKRRQTQMSELVDDFIGTLTKKRIKKDYVILSFRKIYPFDSNSIEQRLERDAIFSRILLNKYIDTSKVNVMETHDINPQHIMDINNKIAIL